MLLNQMAGRLGAPSFRMREAVVGQPTIVPRMRIEHKKAIFPSHGVTHLLPSHFLVSLPAAVPGAALPRPWKWQQGKGPSCWRR